MRHPKLVAALAALTLTAGGLALAGPAMAEDGTSDASPTQEVASSPENTDAASATPTTSEQTAPTTPSTEPSSTEGSPSTESTVTDSPATEETTTSNESSTKPESSPPASETVTAPDSDPATTTPSQTPDTSVEGWWIMPDGGTAENVTWPQTATGVGQVLCGQTAQVDTYPSQAVLDGFAADGILTQGEDYSTVISWRFVYGGDCPPVPGPANPTATIEIQCGLASVTVTNVGENILTASVVIYLDGDFLTALAIPAGQSTSTPIGFAEDSGDHVISVRTGPAFGDVELARAENLNSDCIAAPPVVTPPVVTPPTTTPEPSPTMAPEPETRQAAALVATTDKLAETGSDADWAWAWGGGAILAFIIGVGILLGRKRKA